MWLLMAHTFLQIDALGRCNFSFFMAPFWTFDLWDAFWRFGQGFFFFWVTGELVTLPSDDEGTERTWFEPEQRPRKRVPER